MSVFNPLTSGEMVQGFPPTGITASPASNGNSVFERTRKSQDYLYERIYREAFDLDILPSPVPLNTDVINPSAFALFNQPAGFNTSSGFLTSMLNRRAEQAYSKTITRVGSFPATAAFDVIVESPFVSTAIPLILGYELDSDAGSFPTGVTFPRFSYERGVGKISLHVRAVAPLSNDGEGATLQLRCGLWEVGSDGTGFPSGGVVATPAYATITDADISGDAKFLALLFRKLRDRFDALKNSLDGQSDAKKVAPQAIPTQASGSGAGLVTKMFNYVKRTVASTTVGAGATVRVSTGQLASTTLGPIGAPVLSGFSGTLFTVSCTWAVIPISGVNYWHVEFVNSGTGSVTFAFDAYFVQS
jgi:hypothetical protein